MSKSNADACLSQHLIIKSNICFSEKVFLFFFPISMIVIFVNESFTLFYWKI